MSDVPPQPGVDTPNHVDFSKMVPADSATSVKTQDMVTLMQQLAAPWAEAEKAKHIEETKRHAEETRRAEIDAETSQVYAKYATLLLLGILILAGIALFKGAKDVTEKVLIALITGAGGYLAGRGHAASMKPKS